METLSLIFLSLFPVHECANYAEIVNVLGELRIETKMIVIYRVNSNDKIVSLRAFWDYQNMEDQLNASF